MNTFFWRDNNSMNSRDIPYRFPKRGSEYSTTFAHPAMSMETHLLKYDIIKDYLGVNSIGAELGVYNGGFGEYLRMRCKKLYLVDRMKHRDAAKWEKVIKTIYSEEINRGEIEFHRSEIEQFLLSMPNNYFDFLYYDADHSYRKTLYLGSLCYEKIKPGGRVIFDDYNFTAFPQVIDAINKISENVNNTVIPLDHNQAIIIKPINP